jgi:hypothetical protein
MRKPSVCFGLFPFPNSVCQKPNLPLAAVLAPPALLDGDSWLLFLALKQAHLLFLVLSNFENRLRGRFTMNAPWLQQRYYISCVFGIVSFHGVPVKPKFSWGKSFFNPLRFFFSPADTDDPPY